MKKTNDELQKEILFYVQKLPLPKQVEALDFVKWLWGGPGKGQETFTKEEIGKIECLCKGKGGVKFKNWQSAKKYLEGLTR